MSITWDDAEGNITWDDAEQSIEQAEKDIESRYSLEGDPINQREGGIDYWTDVPALRAELSTKDTREEEAAFLNKHIPGEWGLDLYDNYFITPEGADQLGVEHRGMPLALDAHRFTLSDIADLRGDAPAMIGGSIAAIATQGRSFLLQAFSSGGGAMLGKSLDEAGEALRGENLQSPYSVGGDILTEGALAVGGEGVTRGIGFLGRKAFAPFAHRIDDVDRKVMGELEEYGLDVPLAEFADDPLLRTQTYIIDKVFGLADMRARHNSDRLLRESIRMRNRFGQKAKKGEVGDELVTTLKDRLNRLEGAEIAGYREADNIIDDHLKNIRKKLNSIVEAGPSIKEDIASGRQWLAREAKIKYKVIDENLKNEPIVPTSRITQEVRTLLEDMPPDAEGKISRAFVSKETLEWLNELGNLPDNYTLQHTQAIRSILTEAAYDPTLLPGVSTRHARILRDSVDAAMDEATDLIEIQARNIIDAAGRPLNFASKPLPPGTAAKAVKALRDTNKFYKDNISKFDDVMIQQLAKKTEHGGIEISNMVQYATKHPERIAKVKSMIKPETWQAMQDTYFNNAVDAYTNIDGTINGASLLKYFNKNKKSLSALYGKEARGVEALAKELAARDQKIPTELLTSGRVKDKLLAARQATVAKDAMMKNVYLKGLMKEGLEQEAAVDYMFIPGGVSRIREAYKVYGRDSPVMEKVRFQSMKKLMSNFVKRDDSIFRKVMSGKGLLDELDRYGRPALNEMFGLDATTELYKFAKVAAVATKKNKFTGGLVAAHIAARPLQNLGRLSKFWLISKVFMDARGRRWLTEGISFSPYTRKGMMAINRMNNYLLFMATEHVVPNYLIPEGPPDPNTNNIIR